MVRNILLIEYSYILKIGIEMMSILKKCFGKALYFRRIELKLNQEKMAERCCLSPRQYIDLENGKRLPSFKSLINIIINGGIDLNLFIEEIIKAGYVPEDSVSK